MSEHFLWTFFKWNILIFDLKHLFDLKFPSLFLKKQNYLKLKWNISFWVKQNVWPKTIFSLLDLMNFWKILVWGQPKNKIKTFLELPVHQKISYSFSCTHILTVLCSWQGSSQFWKLKCEWKLSCTSSCPVLPLKLVKVSRLWTACLSKC